MKVTCGICEHCIHRNKTSIWWRTKVGQSMRLLARIRWTFSFGSNCFFFSSPFVAFYTESFLSFYILFSPQFQVIWSWAEFFFSANVIRILFIWKIAKWITQAPLMWICFFFLCSYHWIWIDFPLSCDGILFPLFKVYGGKTIEINEGDKKITIFWHILL